MSESLSYATSVKTKVNIMVECTCGHQLTIEKQNIENVCDYADGNEHVSVLTVKPCYVCLEKRDIKINELKEIIRQLKLCIPVGLNLK